MADLKIKIKGDNTGLKRSLSKSQSMMRTFAKGAGIAFASVGAAVAGIGMAFSRLKAIVDPIADKIDLIGKASKRMGIATDEFQAIAFAARRTGISTEAVEKSFRRMQKVIFDAGKNLSTAKDALDALGLSFEKLQGKTPVEQFEMLASRLALVKDASLRAGVAQDIFGRSGTAIAPLINEYEELKQELDDINGLIGKDGVKAAEDYKDSLENLSTAWDAFVSSSGVIDGMTSSFERLEATLAKIRGGGLVGFADDIKTAAGNLGVLDVLGGPGSIAGKLLGGGIKQTGQDELSERAIRSARQKIASRAATGELETEVNESIAGFISKNGQSSKILSAASNLGGGGTLASLGGDISGGGFSARMNVQERQLDTLMEIKTLTGELVKAMPEFTEREMQTYVDTMSDIFNGN